MLVASGFMDPAVGRALLYVDKACKKSSKNGKDRPGNK
jgi:hypothetical protein